LISKFGDQNGSLLKDASQLSYEEALDI